MWLLDLFFKITDVIVDIWWGKRYGWGSVLWDLAAGACFVVTVIFFVADMIIPGIIGIIVSVFFTILSGRRLQRDIRRKREQQAKASQEMEAP
jgi:MFS superfamily sulfate permease-like transporter